MTTNLASDFMEVMKLPIPVSVEFSSRAGIVDTLEGQVRCKPGDAILTGVKGERWPIQREKFLTNYTPVPPTQLGQDGNYLKKPTKTLAKRMSEPFTVHVGYAKDSLQGHAGDWLLKYADGSQGVVAGDIFEKTYQLLPVDQQKVQRLE